MAYTSKQRFVKNMRRAHDLVNSLAIDLPKHDMIHALSETAIFFSIFAKHDLETHDGEALDFFITLIYSLSIVTGLAFNIVHEDILKEAEHVVRTRDPERGTAA